MYTQAHIHCELSTQRAALIRTSGILFIRLSNTSTERFAALTVRTAARASAVCGWMVSPTDYFRRAVHRLDLLWADRPRQNDLEPHGIMLLADDSNCTSRRHFNVIFVVHPKKYALGVLQPYSCGKQPLSPSSAQLTHPLMADHIALCQREQENTREFTQFRLRNANSALPDARGIQLIEQMYELSHLSSDAERLVYAGCFIFYPCAPAPSPANLVVSQWPERGASATAHDGGARQSARPSGTAGLRAPLLGTRPPSDRRTARA